MIEMIKDMCRIPAVSGREEEMRKRVIDEIAPYCQYEVDRGGNIIAFKKGAAPAVRKVMLDAHMDEVGFIITSIGEEGFLRFTTVGGIDGSVLPGRRVRIGETVGVIGAKPVHFLGEEERKKTLKTEDLVIDIGAKDKSDAERYVQPGDMAAFESEPEEFGDGFLKAKALDDRVGCTILIDLIKSELAYDLYFTFTTREEVGLRGAKTAAYRLSPDFAIVVETTTAADIPGAEERPVCALGKGAVVSFMDRATLYDKSLYDAVFVAAEDKNLRLQPKTAVAGGNNAGAIHLSKSGVRTISLSVPCRYLHGANSVIKVADVYSTRDLVREMAARMAAGEV